MPVATVGHLVAGLAVGRLHARGGRAAVSLCAFAGLGLLPDVDAIGILIGHPLRGALGHRGATHSLLFALMAGAIAALTPLGRGRRLATFGLATLAVLTHPLLDMLTRGGVRLLWPFDGTWRWFGWAPYPMAPVGLGLLTPRGLSLLLLEGLHFSPLALWALWPRRAPETARPVPAPRVLAP